MEREFLFGVIAVQLGQATPRQVMAVASAYLLDRSRSIPDRLLADGVISEQGHGMLGAMVVEAVKAHGGDVSETLHSLGGDQALYRSFGGSLVVDGEGQVSIAPPAGDEDDSIGDSTTVTPEASGRYRVEADGAEVGRGGIGRVLVAFDEHLGREVAVKELLADSSGAAPATPRSDGLSRTAAVAARFLREARVTGQLEHPNIVPVYEVGQRDSGAYYYTMRLVRGRTLSEAIDECRGLGDRLKLLHHFVDLCNAVAYAHSRGVVHRDIKTENVMLGEFGETVVLDWGLAKVRGKEDIRGAELERELKLMEDADAGQTVVGSAIGTPAYMSPEQADGAINAIDQTSDSWSLGAVLYELLTGRPPFTGAMPYEIIGKVLKDPVRPPREVEPEAPPELASVAMKALSRDRTERYMAADLASEVESYMSGGRITAYRYGTVELLRRLVARHRVASVLAGVLLLVVAASSVVLFQAWREATRASHAATRASRAEADARRQAEKESKIATGNLALGLAEKAAILNARREHLKARVYAARALALTPYHPGNTNRFADRRRLDSPQARAALVAIQSSLYDAVVHGRFSHRGRLRGHKRPVRQVAFSPDGKRLATASADGTAAIWDLATNKRLVLRGHRKRVYTVAWSPDGKWLVSGGEDGTVRLWDAADGAPRGQGAPHKQPIMGLAVSPDGEQLASLDAGGRLAMGPASAGGPWRWRDLGAALHTYFSDSTLQFSPDGALLAALSLKGITVLRPETGAVAASLPHRKAYAVRFSPDGSRIAVGGCSHLIRIWRTARDLTNGQVSGFELEATHRGEISDQRALRFTPDSRGLLVSDDGIPVLWDLASGRREAVLDLPGVYLNALDISPRGAVALGQESGEVSLYQLRVRPPARTLGLAGRGSALTWPVWTRDGKHLVTGDWKGAVRIWDVQGRRLMASLLDKGPRIWKVAVSPDGKRLAFGTFADNIQIWDLTRRKRLLQWKGTEEQVRGVAWSPDGKILASAGSNGVRLWDPATGSLLGKKDIVSSVWWLEWTPDGRWIVAGCFDGHVRVFDAPGLKLRHDLTGHRSMVSGMAITPDSKQALSASKDGTVHIWDLERGRLERVFTAHEGWVNRVAVSPNGRWALSSSDDRTARLWELASGRVVQVLGLDNSGVAALFSRDGKDLVINNGTALLVLPFRPDLWRQNPATFQAETERTTGLRLDGLRVVSSSSPASPR